MESALRAGGRNPGLTLIETFAGDAPTGRIARHLARMQAGAEALGWSCDAARLRAALPPPAAQRVRMTLDRAGRIAAAVAPLPTPAGQFIVAVSALCLRADDPWLRLKSSRRAVHDAARAALAPGIDEAILLNDRGEACEGGITSLFFDRGRGLRTPPLACGLLPGILRAEILEAGAREEVLAADDLPRVRLWVGNSLRGLVPARLAPGLADGGVS